MIESLSLSAEIQAFEVSAAAAQPQTMHVTRIVLLGRAAGCSTLNVSHPLDAIFCLFSSIPENKEDYWNRLVVRRSGLRVAGELS